MQVNSYWCLFQRGKISSTVYENLSDLYSKVCDGGKGRRKLLISIVVFKLLRK